MLATYRNVAKRRSEGDVRDIGAEIQESPWTVLVLLREARDAWTSTEDRPVARVMALVTGALAKPEVFMGAACGYVLEAAGAGDAAGRGTLLEGCAREVGRSPLSALELCRVSRRVPLTGALGVVC